MTSTILVNKPTKMNWDGYSNFPKFFAEIKFDGMRIQIVKDDKVRLLRENGIDKTKQFPELFKSLSGLPEDTVLDGEICILNDSFSADFQKLQTRTTTDDLRIKLLSQKIPATFVAFDILRFKGKNLESKTLAERKEILEHEIKDTNEIKVIKRYTPSYLFKHLKKEMEGIVLKDPSSKTWIKFRQYLENDFKVVGVTSEKKLISALELENSKGESVGRVNYTGYPQTTEWKKKVVGMTAVVQSMFTNQGKVRFPILKELRGATK